MIGVLPHLKWGKQTCAHKEIFLPGFAFNVGQQCQSLILENTGGIGSHKSSFQFTECSETV